MDLTDEQWQPFQPFFEEHLALKRGRPCKHLREVINGILWILRTGAQWKYLPDHYPPYQTCHRWFQRWVEDGKMEKILTSLARDLYERGGVDITECLFRLKKGPWSCKTKRGKGTKVMGIANGDSLPVVICTYSTQPHEIRLVEKPLVIASQRKSQNA